MNIGSKCHLETIPCCPQRALNLSTWKSKKFFCYFSSFPQNKFRQALSEKSSPGINDSCARADNKFRLKDFCFQRKISPFLQDTDEIICFEIGVTEPLLELLSRLTKSWEWCVQERHGKLPLQKQFKGITRLKMKFAHKGEIVYTSTFAALLRHIPLHGLHGACNFDNWNWTFRCDFFAGSSRSHPQVPAIRRRNEQCSRNCLSISAWCKSHS